MNRKTSIPDAATEASTKESFRDHLSTADREGYRKWIYARKPDGRFYSLRTYVSWFLLAIMFAGPFIRIDGNPLLLLNIVEGRFSIAGNIFWPQDIAIFSVAMLLFIMGIIVFTTAFGRLWCGWVCPQTLLMEMVFRKIEYLIEGNSAQQRLLAKAPWTANKIYKKGLKHAVFLGFSFLIGNTLLSYVIGVEQLFAVMIDDPRQHLAGLGFMVLFTVLFYGIFARFREQACTFICPYGRLQSTILDENSLIVAYDHKRGEGRLPLRKNQTWADRLAEGFGDCVNCKACVAVCPTGIDIRNGLQMECVQCTACIDACDSVMQKVGRPKGLIRYASLNSIERSIPFRFTARLGWYVATLCLLIALFCYLVWSRPDVNATFLRAPGALFTRTPEGQLQNLYTVKIINKRSETMPLELRLRDLKGSVKPMSGAITVGREQMVQMPVLVSLEEPLSSGKQKIEIDVFSGQKHLQTVHTTFIGPRNP